VDYFFHFAHPWIALGGAFAAIIISLLRLKLHKPITYRYSLVGMLKKEGYTISSYYRWIPFVLRLCSLIMLGLLIGRPQLVNIKSKVHIEGLDIMLIIDASGSMQCFDDVGDRRPRFDVAKQEAIRFIEKRDNDQIGLIIFGKDAISRCPLTLDRHILKGIIHDLKLGDIDPDGTVLSIAMSMGVNRLKNSKAKSKIIIMLTDGEPTVGLDIEPRVAVQLAKKCGIKVYTIGVGGEHGGLWYDPLFGMRAMGFRLNKQLLQTVAQETGGQFFLAQNPDDVRRIYDTIDALEKTEYETTIFSNYIDLVFPFIAVICILLLFEAILAAFVWCTV
jgi:Ca-activated chloride channel family protein